MLTKDLKIDLFSSFSYSSGLPSSPLVFSVLTDIPNHWFYSSLGPGLSESLQKIISLQHCWGWSMGLSHTQPLGVCDLDMLLSTFHTKNALPFECTPRKWNTKTVSQREVIELSTKTLIQMTKPSTSRQYGIMKSKRQNKGNMTIFQRNVSYRNEGIFLTLAHELNQMGLTGLLALLPLSVEGLERRGQVQEFLERVHWKNWLHMLHI